jgi:hypothetical protein
LAPIADTPIADTPIADAQVCIPFKNIFVLKCGDLISYVMTDHQWNNLSILSQDEAHR